MAGSFVIEKNGKASNIHFDSLPDFEGLNADSILRTSIGCMDWVAAHQEGSRYARNILLLLWDTRSLFVC